jgi:hypothetical protein
MLNRNHFFYLGNFLLEHPLNALLEGYNSTHSPAAGSRQAHFDHSIRFNINQFNTAAIPLQHGTDFIQSRFYFFLHYL